MQSLKECKAFSDWIDLVYPQHLKKKLFYKVNLYIAQAEQHTKLKLRPFSLEANACLSLPHRSIQSTGAGIILVIGLSRRELQDIASAKVRIVPF